MKPLFSRRPTAADPAPPPVVPVTADPPLPPPDPALDAAAAERAAYAQRAALAAERAATPPTHVVVHAPPPVFTLPRRRWPGVLGAGLIGAAAAALIVSNHYDGRSIGQRVDAGLEAAQQGVQNQVEDLKDGAAAVAARGEGAADRVAAKVTDASITASVKAALVADPALSALAIEVETVDGVVRLRGPAPDPAARERAAVLAAAREGVRGVDNQLRVPGTPGGAG